MLHFRTSAKGTLPIRLCVLDCDGIIFNSNQLKTQAYRSTLSELGCTTEDISKFVSLHLSDVSVSRFVKFKKFFADILQDTEAETKTEQALEGYSRNCLKLYSELTPESGAMAFLENITIPTENKYVISGGAQTELNHVFEQHQILTKFNKVLGSPTTKIDHLSKILDETNILPEEVLFIGDGWTDFKTSKAVGCHFCFLKEMSDWDDNVKQMKGFEDMVTICDVWTDVINRLVVEEGK
jgi:phosphoglycolate phosphatase-like HAD superfamily hydrolase